MLLLISSDFRAHGMDASLALVLIELATACFLPANILVVRFMKDTPLVLEDSHREVSAETQDNRNAFQSFHCLDP